jgi:hypothetical protein
MSASTAAVVAEEGGPTLACHIAESFPIVLPRIPSTSSIFNDDEASSMSRREPRSTKGVISEGSAAAQATARAGATLISMPKAAVT